MAAKNNSIEDKIDLILERMAPGDDRVPQMEAMIAELEAHVGELEAKLNMLSTAIAGAQSGAATVDADSIVRAFSNNPSAVYDLLHLIVSGDTSELVEDVCDSGVFIGKVEEVTENTVVDWIDSNCEIDITSSVSSQIDVDYFCAEGIMEAMFRGVAGMGSSERKKFLKMLIDDE